MSLASLIFVFASAYLLTLANPPTILFFAGLFASIAAWSTFEQAAVFALGIFTGSLLWWLALTGLVAGCAAKLAPNVLAWINRLSGLVGRFRVRHYPLC